MRVRTSAEEPMTGRSDRSDLGDLIPLLVGDPAPDSWFSCLLSPPVASAPGADRLCRAGKRHALVKQARTARKRPRCCHFLTKILFRSRRARAFPTYDGR